MSVPYQYLQIFSNIEEEIIELSYKITFDEDQKRTYSTYIGELELRIFTLMESVIKFRTPEMSQNEKYEERFKKLYSSKTQLPNIYVVLNSYNLNKKEYTDILNKDQDRITGVVDGELQRISKKNEKYNNAYQNLRHSFINSLPVFGTVEYLFEALAVLYLALDTPGLSHIFAVYYLDKDGKKWIWIPSNVSKRQSIE
ncbi:hypothetical protein HU830_07795 [Lactobacillus sp. DCY120]|uniref:Uncharacterized protein n=1 Tax=Bombilactobacillus apium TaxID=2675299 RepID=A0A850R1Q3_9LACO|nr:hypothetical protein [Bombilactobacillus apium]NVY97049.1 hypothetical protein [Bombilactobacillus apium]